VSGLWIDVKPIVAKRLHAVRAFVPVEPHGGEQCASGISAVSDAPPGRNPHPPAGRPGWLSQWSKIFLCLFLRLTGRR